MTVSFLCLRLIKCLRLFKSTPSTSLERDKHACPVLRRRQVENLVKEMGIKVREEAENRRNGKYSTVVVLIQKHRNIIATSETRLGQYFLNHPCVPSRSIHTDAVTISYHFHFSCLFRFILPSLISRSIFSFFKSMLS